MRALLKRQINIQTVPKSINFNNKSDTEKSHVRFSLMTLEERVIPNISNSRKLNKISGQRKIRRNLNLKFLSSDPESEYDNPHSRYESHKTSGLFDNLFLTNSNCMNQFIDITSEKQQEILNIWKNERKKKRKKSRK